MKNSVFILILCFLFVQSYWWWGTLNLEGLGREHSLPNSISFTQTFFWGGGGEVHFVWSNVILQSQLQVTVSL